MGNGQFTGTHDGLETTRLSRLLQVPRWDPDDLHYNLLPIMFALPHSRMFVSV